MKYFKFLSTGLVLSLFMLLTSATAEARAHFSFGFGFTPPTVVEHHVVTPVYVEEYYAAPGFRRPPCCDRVWVGTRREIHAYPSYRERVIVQPAPVFSFGICH